MWDLSGCLRPPTSRAHSRIAHGVRRGLPPACLISTVYPSSSSQDGDVLSTLEEVELWADEGLVFLKGDGSKHPSRAASRIASRSGSPKRSQVRALPPSCPCLAKCYEGANPRGTFSDGVLLLATLLLPRSSSFILSIGRPPRGRRRSPLSAPPRTAPRAASSRPSPRASPSSTGRPARRRPPRPKRARRRVLGGPGCDARTRSLPLPLHSRVGAFPPRH